MVKRGLIVIFTGAILFAAGLFFFVADSVGLSLSFARPASQQRATVLFGGDMMFDRSVREAMHENGNDFIFSCLGDTLKKPDLTVANLEGPITDRVSKSVGSKPGDLNNTRFTF